MTLERLLAFASLNPILSLALVGLTVAIVYTEVARLFQGYRTVAPGGVTELINRENALLVDLSPQADFEKGHIAGARHVPLAQFDPENKALAKVRDLPVVLVCRSGVTAAGAARRLVKAGFQRVYLLDGGMNAWQQADLPVVKGRE